MRFLILTLAARGKAQPKAKWYDIILWGSKGVYLWDNWVRIYCMIPDDLDDGGSKEPLNSHLNKDSLIPLWHQIWVILVCISPKEHTPNAIIKACKCRCISCAVWTPCATTCICCLATDIVDSKQLLEQTEVWILQTGRLQQLCDCTVSQEQTRGI